MNGDYFNPKHEKKELIMEKELIENFINSIPDGFIFFDFKFNVMEINEAALKMLGKKREDVSGINILTLFPYLKGTERLEKYHEVLKTGNSFLVEDLIPHPSFGELHLNVRAFRIGGGLGIIATDITELKRIQKEKAQTEAYLRSSLNSIPEGVLLLDDKARFTYVNPTFLKWIGREREDFIGKTVREISPPFLTPRTTQIIARRAERRIQTGDVISSAEVELIGKHGIPLPVSYSAARIEDDEKTVLGEVVFIKDMSSYKQAEEELARSNRDLEHFAYVASHDLQEPLRMVMSYTQLLERRYGDALGEDAQEFIQYIIDGAVRMQDMINALLTYSRVQTKGREPESVEANKILEQVLDNLQILIEETHAEITRDDLPMICADEMQMVQLFQNLIKNAIVYRSENAPRVHIHSEKKGNEWLFSVKDNGMGIDLEYVEKIFQIFTRLHSQDTHKGTGIGLAICKRIVERHGGKIWAESEKGEGSTFYFTFPMGGR